jgi:hypothetical protein
MNGLMGLCGWLSKRVWTWLKRPADKESASRLGSARMRHWMACREIGFFQPHILALADVAAAMRLT